MGTLTVKEIDSLPPGKRYHDGEGLYLQVQDLGKRSWLFRYWVKVDGKSRERVIGLGAYSTVTLAEARRRAKEHRAALAKGVDPLAVKRQAQAIPPAPAQATTFAQAAESYIAKHAAGWRNAKHAAQWTSSLKTYAFPTLGDLAAKDITAKDVLACLEPIWNEKTETANRVRGRIEAILDATKVAEGWQLWTNPAVWRGGLKHNLPARAKVAQVKNHPAMPFADLPAFMVKLRSRAGVAASALAFCILTAARSGMVRGAVWSEIDRPNALWTVPDIRMKSRRAHRVPLPQAALTILDSMLPERGALVFPGDRPERPLSDMALTAVLRRMGLGHFTVHGFRSTFADWRAETTQHPEDLQEAALSHTLGDKTQAAYQRGDLVARRRKLMADWAEYCASGEVPWVD